MGGFGGLVDWEDVSAPDHLRLLFIALLQTFRHLPEPVGCTGMLTGCEWRERF